MVMVGTGEVDVRVDVSVGCRGVVEWGCSDRAGVDAGRGGKECASGCDGCCVVVAYDEFGEEGAAARREVVEGC